MSNRNLLANPRKTAFIIAGIYVLVSCIYVFFSDQFVFLLFSDNSGFLAWISVVKGWLFVFVSGALIYFLVLFVMQKVKAREKELLADRKSYEEKLKRLAYIDIQTNLPNRLSLDESLEEKISCELMSQAALYFIDLDNFKYINDTMGHSFGDSLIAAVADVLRVKLSCDADIFRFGGDEFVIFAEKCHDIEQVKAFAERIADCFRGAFAVEDSSVDATVSIGVARYPVDGQCLDDLLKYADLAVNRAKSAGRNRYVIYSSEMKSELLERGRMEQCLRTALENNEFEVVYQPQYDIKSSKITGFEALLRWKSPQLGNVSPEVFIKVAEDTHMMVAIGSWVLRTACVFLKQMHGQVDAELCMSVNVSVQQLLQDDFAETVLHVLDFVDINPMYLELEITESMLMESYDSIILQLTGLMTKGVKIAMDDFGQGYSSLSYLKDIPLSTLKIDKVFIDSILEEQQEKSIISDIIAIGRKMGLEVIAEGVEVKEQFDYLERSLCDKIQGYYISKPLCEEDAIKIIGGQPSNSYEIYKGFRWKPEYSVNVESLDVQHKKLFAIGSAAAKILFEDCGDETIASISPLFTELDDYAAYHFEYEENMMKLNEYPHYESHCTEHEEIRKRLAKTMDMDFKKMEKQDLRDLVDFVFLWISNHILRTDKRYSKYMNDKGIY